jgi:hypothetical protein
LRAQGRHRVDDVAGLGMSWAQGIRQCCEPGDDAESMASGSQGWHGADDVTGSRRLMVTWAQEWLGVDEIKGLGMAPMGSMASPTQGQGRGRQMWRTRPGLGTMAWRF